MKERMFLLQVAFFFVFTIFSSAISCAQKYSISGTISDASTGETILGASVFVEDMEKGVSSNVYGFYSISLPKGSYKISYSFIGYKTIKKTVELNQDITFNAKLESAVIMGSTVEIVGKKGENVNSTDVGRVELEVDQIKKLPALLGEVDILKTIQLLPGIQSAGEGNSGFYVRGGGPDQNLILVDNAVVYNASHLFGFFSVFNADAVKHIDVIKGGMPAKFGGRVSSVLEVTLKEGNNQEFKFEGGIGLISSRFTAQGPIKKDKSSFIVSGRRTYIDLLVKPFVNPESNFSGSGYYFYDLNMKVNHRFSNKDQVFASAYFGRDVFGFKSKTAGFNTSIPWGNALASFKWNHLFSDKLLLSTMASFSEYKFTFEAEQEDFKFALNSGIRDLGGKTQLTYYPGVDHEITTGIDYVFHRFSPGTLSASSGSTEFDVGSEELNYSHETAWYLQDQFDLGEKIRINAGIRAVYYAQVGPFKRYIPADNDNFAQPEEPTEVNYSKGDIVTDYFGLEPRFNIRYKLNERSSIKAGYTHNYQFVHLASLSPTSLPTDVWIPSSELVRPQFGKQGSIGYFIDFRDGKYEGSVETYYKDLKNLVEYKDGVQPEDNVANNVDNNLTFGDGQSYGVEFFLKKKTGNLNGWVGYTWSKTNRTFEDINEGRTFNAKFDRRHDLSVVGNYKLNEKLTFGASFVYATGNSITLPASIYVVENNVLFEYGDRNSFRMDAYHRVDISVTLTPKPTREIKDRSTGEVILRNRKIESNWNLSVYNLYSRMNPYFIYFGPGGNFNEGTASLKAYQVSLFPILPSVTWNFKF